MKKILIFIFCVVSLNVSLFSAPSSTPSLPSGSYAPGAGQGPCVSGWNSPRYGGSLGACPDGDCFISEGDILHKMSECRGGQCPLWCSSYIQKCPAGQVAGEDITTCVTPPPEPEPDKCNPIAGQYTSSSGQCVDCSSFGDNVSGKSSCACDAKGSTYVPNSVSPYAYESSGGKTYERQSSKCANGDSVPVYTNPVDTPKDANGTGAMPPTPTNPTNPTNPTTPTDPTDINGTKPTDPNSGTGGAGGTGGGAGGGTTTPTNPTTPDPVKPDPTTPNNPATPSAPSYSDVLKSLASIQTNQNDLKSSVNKLINDNLANGSAQLGATNGVKNAVDGTTNAVNKQGDAITGKLNDILNATKNGTGAGTGTGTKDGNGTGDKVDLSNIEKKLDTLHDDMNSSNSLLSGIKGKFDNNDSVKASDINDTDFKLSDFLPEEKWFEANKLNLKFNTYDGGCYCETAEFVVAGRRFEFPSQESLSYIPFTTISNIFMAFIYVLGLKAFLKD